MIAFEDLQGTWHLTRRIEDRVLGCVGHLDGQAIWRTDGAGLVQDETGVLHFGQAAPMQATRRYLWRKGAGGIAVLFDDARPFHIVPAPGQEAEHLCPPDRYRVSYTAHNRDHFETLWHVTGPRKDATIRSWFQRA